MIHKEMEMKRHLIIVGGTGAKEYNEMDFSNVRKGIRTPKDFIEQFKETGETDFEGFSIDDETGEKYFSVEVRIFDITEVSQKEVMRIVREHGNKTYSDNQFYVEAFDVS